MLCAAFLLERGHIALDISARRTNQNKKSPCSTTYFILASHTPRSCILTLICTFLLSPAPRHPARSRRTKPLRLGRPLLAEEESAADAPAARSSAEACENFTLSDAGGG